MAKLVKAVIDELGYGGVRVVIKHDNAKELVRPRHEITARRKSANSALGLASQGVQVQRGHRKGGPHLAGPVPHPERSCGARDRRRARPEMPAVNVVRLVGSGFA